jgi:hypothetical protein
LISRCCVVLVLDPLCIPLVVDICVLQPPIATSGETASASQVFPKGPVVRACWCALGAEPWVCPCANKWFHCWDKNLLEGMSRWFPSKTKIQKWIEDQEKDFAEAQNKNPNLSTEDWLGRYIFTDIHEIFFGGIHQELYEWLARLADTQFEIRSRTPVVWTSTLIKKIKRVDNTVSRAVDHWFDSTIGGYVTEFVVDRVESYSQAERYFFKGPRGKFLHFLKLKIKMLLHEKNILKVQ